MKFQKGALEGLWLIDVEKMEDERGFFARTWCREAFEIHGLDTQISQCSMVFNEKKGTLRGMHFQRAPYTETKTVLCWRGAIYDVVIDLRPGSKTYRKWEAFELRAEKPQILYIPKGFAHGYQTLTGQSEIYYQISMPYEAKAAAGVRWNDPAFGIEWPDAPERIIADKDQAWPDFARKEAAHASL